MTKVIIVITIMTTILFANSLSKKLKNNYYYCEKQEIKKTNEIIKLKVIETTRRTCKGEFEWRTTKEEEKIAGNLTIKEKTVEYGYCTPNKIGNKKIILFKNTGLKYTRYGKIQ